MYKAVLGSCLPYVDSTLAQCCRYPNFPKLFFHFHAGNNDCQAALAQWRLQLITDLVCLQARVLPSPYIYFGDGGTKGYKQFWDPKTEAPTRKFLKPVIISRLLVVSVFLLNSMLSTPPIYI